MRKTDFVRKFKFIDKHGADFQITWHDGHISELQIKCSNRKAKKHFSAKRYKCPVLVIPYRFHNLEPGVEKRIINDIKLALTILFYLDTELRGFLPTPYKVSITLANKIKLLFKKFAGM